MQPTDRLGQPLSVGDWVVQVSSAPHDVVDAIGWEACICNVDENDYDLPVQFSTPDRQGQTGTWNNPRHFEKINPKQQTTAWDKCVWRPEGVTT